MRRTALLLIVAFIVTVGCQPAPTPTVPPATLVPPTPMPPTAAAPTATPVPPTSTPVPTATSVPPTSTPALPTATRVPPTPAPAPFSIQNDKFAADDKGDCNEVDVAITKVNGTSLSVQFKNGSLAIRGGKMTVWCYGAKHTWMGKLTYAGYTFDSDQNAPLQFTVDKDKGYIYVTGKGTVTAPDGQVIQFPQSPGQVQVGNSALSGTGTAAVAATPAGFSGSAWNGIPIIPEATSTEELDSEDYEFVAKASPAEVRQYYEREMLKWQWQSNPDQLPTSNDPIELVFSKGNQVVHMLITKQGETSSVFIHITNL